MQKNSDLNKKVELQATKTELKAQQDKCNDVRNS